MNDNYNNQFRLIVTENFNELVGLELVPLQSSMELRTEEAAASPPRVIFNDAI